MMKAKHGFLSTIFMDRSKKYLTSARSSVGVKTTIVNEETDQFDVILVYNIKDKCAVKGIALNLKKESILPWFDEWELRPGIPWQKELEKQISMCKSAAVFVGKSGIGPWQDMELDVLLRRLVKSGLPVIPVILPDCETIPDLPIFLESMTWVDFREEDPTPLKQLIWGITGKHPRRMVMKEGC